MKVCVIFRDVLLCRNYTAVKGLSISISSFFSNAVQSVNDVLNNQEIMETAFSNYF